MYNFRIEFVYPWFLLLFLAALALTLIPYFRLSKKYRKTRNRITSMVLHLVIMFLATTTLAGMTFSYDVQNEENVILYLVDVSQSEEEVAIERDKFLEKALEYSRYDGYTVGVVTFGFDQELAVDFTTDIDKVMDAYEEAEKPDTTATNIADALRYAKDLLEEYEIAKIVLVTDGEETDEDALSVIKSIVALDIALDVAQISPETNVDDIQLTNITFPDYHISVGDECSISLTIQSTSDAAINVELYDNGDVDIDASKNIAIGEGSQTVVFTHKFETDGLHDITFKIAHDDAWVENNTYTSYYFLQEFNEVLILESSEGQSEALTELLKNKEEIPYNVNVVNIKNAPLNVEDLREYDQVILNNIANKDMPYGFDEVLEMYVSEFGGGLFTVGGSDAEGNAHAYNRKDMYNTLYQQMLPVQAINYTQPCAVMIIVDTSGSMTSSPDDSGFTMLDWAKAGAAQCVEMLSDRDYVGVMTLSTDYEMKQELIPCTQKNKIFLAINSLDKGNGSTNYAPSIDRAGESLATVDVERRHIIIVSDGQPTDSFETKGDTPGYAGFIEENYKNHGITLSIMAIGLSEGYGKYDELKTAAEELGHGKLYTPEPGGDIIELMRKDLNIQAIDESTEKAYQPVLSSLTSPVAKGVEYFSDGLDNKVPVNLGGFYGVRAKKTADVYMESMYGVPLYTQWKYGKGMVGSFMSDLNGQWSSEFLDNENGKKLLFNMIAGLMPTENIRPNEINLTMVEDNYTNQLSVYSSLQAGEYISGKIVEVTKDGEAIALSLNETTSTDKQELRKMGVYVETPLSASNKYSRCTLIVKASGIYKIVLEKRNAEGEVLSTYETYKSFAYSKEYDSYLDETEIPPYQSLKELVSKADGNMIADLENPEEIFEDFVTSITYT